MSVEDNMKLVDSIFKAVNSRDMTLFRKIHAKDVVSQTPADNEPRKGLEAHVEEMEGFIRAFPDLRVEKVRAFGQGEWICLEYLVTGTNKGIMTGPDGSEIAPTGKALRLPCLGVMKISNGKIVWERDYWDMAGFATQLGLGP